MGNLSWETELEDLEKLFSNYVVVKKCYLLLDGETGRKRGFAFLDLNNYNSEKSYWWRLRHGLGSLNKYFLHCFN